MALPRPCDSDKIFECDDAFGGVLRHCGGPAHLRKWLESNPIEGETVETLEPNMGKVWGKVRRLMSDDHAAHVPAE